MSQAVGTVTFDVPVVVNSTTTLNILTVNGLATFNDPVTFTDNTTFNNPSIHNASVTFPSSGGSPTALTVSDSGNASLTLASASGALISPNWLTMDIRCRLNDLNIALPFTGAPILATAAAKLIFLGAIPVGYRPSVAQNFSHLVTINANTVGCNLLIGTNGDITISNGLPATNFIIGDQINLAGTPLMWVGSS